MLNNVIIAIIQYYLTLPETFLPYQLAITMYCDNKSRFLPFCNSKYGLSHSQSSPLEAFRNVRRPHTQVDYIMGNIYELVNWPIAYIQMTVV